MVEHGPEQAELTCPESGVMWQLPPAIRPDNEQDMLALWKQDIVKEEVLERLEGKK